MHPTLHSSQQNINSILFFKTNTVTKNKQTNKQTKQNTEELNRINVLSLEKIQTKNQFKQNKNFKTKASQKK